MEWMLPPASWTTSATSWKSMSSAFERDLDVLDLAVDLEERDVDAVHALEIAELVGQVSIVG